MIDKNVSRTYRILLDLLSRENCLSASALAKKYNCSERTIRTEINYIKSILINYNVEVINKKSQGYILINNSKFSMKEIKEKIIAEYQEIPSNYNERVYYILKLLLLAEDYITIDELSEQLFISRVSVSQCLKRVREILDRYYLKIENKSHYGLKIQGSEKNIRKCIIEHGIEYTQLNFWNSQINNDVQNLPFFKNIDISLVERIIKEEITRANIDFYDMFYNNLIIHVVVALKRIQEKSYIEDFYLDNQNVYKSDMVIAQTIANRLSQEFNVVIPDSEIKYMAVHLIGKKIAHIEEEKLLHDETYILVNKMLIIASKEYNINFVSDSILKKDMYIHIKSALERIKLGVQLHNPMIKEIKNNFPFPYEIAIRVCYNNEIKLYDLNEEELSFVVIHFAAALERLKVNSSFKRKILIFCASGIGTVRLLEAKLKKEFKDYIDITTMYNVEHLLEIQDHYDLILTTIPLPSTSEHILCVSPILTNEELTLISKILLKNNKSKFYDIKDVFKLELFSIKYGKQNKEDLLKEISHSLYKLSFVENSFYDNLMKREEIVDTVVGNQFAIPHSLKNDAIQNGIYVCILKEPIRWTSEKMVSVLFVMAIKRSEAKYFEKIYDLMVDIASDIESVNKLIDCCNFEEMISLLEASMKKG